MRSIYFTILCGVLLVNCGQEQEASNYLKGEWEAFHLTSSGQAVPEYLVEDFTLHFKEEGKYQGNLEWLRLSDKGDFSVTEDQLILGTDTFAIQKQSIDTLVLQYESESVPFVIHMTTKK